MTYRKHRKIIVPYGAKRSIARQFKVSEKTVDNAINFYSESELAENIRESAKNDYGGREVIVSRFTKS